MKAMLRSKRLRKHHIPYRAIRPSVRQKLEDDSRMDFQKRGRGSSRTHPTASDVVNTEPLSAIDASAEVLLI
ncbi:hypothetical protein D3C73_714840 [compost metagenome]